METVNRRNRPIFINGAGGFILGAVLISVFLLTADGAGAKDEIKPPSEPIATAPITPPVTVTINTTRAEMPENKIYYGNWTEAITDPRCIDLKSLVKNTAEYKEIEKKKIPPGQARYWILMSHANDTVTKGWIPDCSQANNISFICDRKLLFTVLRRQDAFKNKSDQDLLGQFDLGKKIIDFTAEKEKKEKKLPAKEKAYNPNENMVDLNRNDLNDLFR